MLISWSQQRIVNVIMYLTLSHRVIMAVHSHQKWIFSVFISRRLDIIAQSLACLPGLVIKVMSSRSSEISWYCDVLLRILVLIILTRIIIWFWITKALVLSIFNRWLTRMLFPILLAHWLRRWPHYVLIIVWGVRGNSNRSTPWNFITLSRIRAWR